MAEGILETYAILVTVLSRWIDMVFHHSITADRTMRTSDPNIYAARDRANAFHLVLHQRL
jgi:hypothetical protein